MAWVPVLALVVPLLGATAMATGGPLLGWRLRDGLGIAVAAATTVLAVVTMLAGRLIVSWVGGWEPVEGAAIGIALVVDPVGAGAAALAALLTVAALVFSWRYFEAIGTLYHVLMLLFLGGMVGFTVTGDLFNLFVFFELLTTAAYALTGYQIESEGPLQGAFNFAVMNTLGAFVMLAGIGLLYGRTGTLNLADMGLVLAGSPLGVVAVVGFALVTVGLFTKAALVPLHFWLPDAHSVAPSPVSVLLSGVMIELGLYGWARLYWTVFADVGAPPLPSLRVTLAVLGALTAVVAAVLAVAQLQVKRLLAYSSVSHSGLILVGVAMLDATATAGAAIYTVSHGALKGALFLAAGMLLHHHGTVSETALRDRGRRQLWLAALVVLGALGLAGLPPFGTGLGRQLIEERALHHGLAWVRPVFVVAEALTAGAVLRVAGRVFLGWGPGTEPADEEPAADEERETADEEAAGRTPAVMRWPATLLVAVALAVGSWPGTAAVAEAAARLFTDTEAYRRAVMDGVAVGLPAIGPASWFSATSVVLGVVSTLLALAVAGVALARDHLPETVVAVARRVGGPPLRGLRATQSGHVGDYAAWFTLGAAAIGVAYLWVFP